MLWALDDVCNRSKHTLSVPFGSVFQSGDFRGTGNSAIEIHLDPICDRDKNEVVFARFTTGAELHYLMDSTVHVVFDDISILGGEPALAVLSYFVRLVEDVLAALEAQAQRLGLAGF